MAKSKETFNKREKEKQRQRARQEKHEKMLNRKSNASKGNGLDGMMAYVDEFGNISDTPPDPSKRKVVNAEDIQLSVTGRNQDDPDAAMAGTVSYFNTEKGYGFITDSFRGERLFFHVSNVQGTIDVGDKVSYETERTPKGMNAINIAKT
ncbi:MAG TPA: cold shock domain-containing protein [Chitinophagaceae bacterium]|jgi:cold shock CspA family protein